MKLASPEDLFAGHASPQNPSSPIDPAAVTSLAHAQALLAQLQEQQQALRLENQQLHAAQQALAASQARLHAAEAVAGIGSYELELASGVLHFSDGMYRLFGEEPHAFTPSLAWIDARSNPDDGLAIRRLLDQAVQTGQPYHYTRRIRRADGQWRTLHSHGRLVSDGAGHPIRLEGVVEDKTDQHLTEQALRRSEEQFRLLVTASSDVVYKMSADWQQMHHLDGKTFMADTNATTGSWLQAYIPAEDQPQVGAAIARAVHDKALFEYEHRVVRSDGSLGWVHSRAVPVLDAAGNLVEWMGAASDITTRKQAEQQILRLKDELARHTEDKYRTLFNAIDEGFCVAEVLYNEQGAAVDYRFLEVNRMFEQQTGVAQATGKLGSQLSTGTEPYWLHTYAQVVQTGQAVRLENYHPASRRWYEAYSARVGGEGSRQVCTVFHDVTERKNTEEHLRHSEERLQQALSIDTVGVLFFDLEGGIHGANEAFTRMSGFAQADFASGRVRLEQVTAPEFLDITRQSLQELRTHGKSTPYEKQYLRADGSRRWGLFAGKRLSENEAVKFVLDITDRKQAEHQLHAVNEQLLRINADLDNFIYTASHDLRSPIQNIEGLLHALVEELPPQIAGQQSVSPLLVMMQEAIDRFQRTIQHLTDLTKLQKEHDLPAADVLLQPVVADVLLDVQPLQQQVGARIEVALEAGCAVLFSEKNLRSVVYNLVSNAIKYHHPDREPRVWLQCGQEGDYTVLRVQDNGLGLAAERQGELFTLFRRFHDHVEGNGIGLYMVKRMVENAGGHLEVHSQLGVGSTFCVYFRR